MPSPASLVLPNTLVPWACFDASLGITLNGGVVEHWDGQAGGHRVSQTTAGSRPTPGTNINGRATVGFDGTDDHLLGGAGLVSLLAGTKPYTLYIIAKLSGSLSTPRALVGCGAASGSQYFYHYHLNTDGYGRAGGSSNMGTQTPGNTNPFDYCVTFSGSQTNSWVNGVQSINAASNSGNPSCTTFCIGALWFNGSAIQPFLGDIGQIMVYPGVHPTAQRTAISAALRAKFGM